MLLTGCVMCSIKLLLFYHCVETNKGIGHKAITYTQSCECGGSLRKENPLGWLGKYGHLY